MNHTLRRWSMTLISSVITRASLTASGQAPIANENRLTKRATAFAYDQAALPAGKPWSAKKFRNNPRNFQFAIIGDRAGGANVEETFKIAMAQLNLLQPEFVINLGDVIEGYSDEKAELHAEWDEVDKILKTLDMPVFRTPGNHDSTGGLARKVWSDVLLLYLQRCAV